jgi:hypothetical protein
MLDPSPHDNFIRLINFITLLTVSSSAEAAENEVQKRQALREVDKLKEEHEEVQQQIQEKTVSHSKALYI